MDTGALVSVLSRTVYEENFRSTHLRPSTARLVTYSHSPIDVLDCMPASVIKDNVKCSTTFFFYCGFLFKGFMHKLKVLPSSVPV